MKTKVYDEEYQLVKRARITIGAHEDGGVPDKIMFNGKIFTETGKWGFTWGVEVVEAFNEESHEYATQSGEKLYFLPNLNIVLLDFPIE